MEPDAPWRQAAAARIEKIRKADLKVVVKDKNGQPIAGADVRAHQTRQAFAFGTCVPADKLKGAGNERYRQITTELFNTATLENNLKWVPLDGEWGPSFTLDAAKEGIAWLHDHGLDVRGHVLVWPGWRNLPRSLHAHEKDPAALRAITDKHIRDVAGAVKGTVVHWDVMNEPFDNHDLIDILGDDAMVDWFKTARAVDPAPKLFINDYAILSGSGGDTPHRAFYDKTIQYLVDHEAPLDGIGLQGHFGDALTGPEDMLAILDRYARFGKTIYITEYDVVINDEELAGQFTRDFYTTLFSHPAVGGIIMWGFWDGAHWKNNAPLYRRDWSLKPAGQAYRDLVLKDWRTDQAGKTDVQGAFGTRGFLGDYDIEVRAGGKQKTVKATLVQGGSAINVVLE
jgi:GH35 family endo-1,4-beta-xylanase